MGKNNASNVGIGKPAAAGGVYSAKLGSTAPANASTALDTAFENLGYISEDGLTNTIESDTEDIRAWGGDVVHNERTSRSETFTFTGIETNSATLKEAYGDENVTVEEGAIKVLHNGNEMPYRMYAFNIVLSKTRIKRIFVPEGKITSLGDVTYNGTSPVGYAFTLSARPDDAGNTAYEWIEEV